LSGSPPVDQEGETEVATGFRLLIDGSKAEFSGQPRLISRARLSRLPVLVFS
jgi:hypothetical protein